MSSPRTMILMTMTKTTSELQLFKSFFYLSNLSLSFHRHRSIDTIFVDVELHLLVEGKKNYAFSVMPTIQKTYLRGRVFLEIFCR